MKYNITSDILSQMDTATVYSVSKIIRVERQEPIEGRWNLPGKFLINSIFIKLIIYRRGIR